MLVAHGRLKRAPLAKRILYLLGLLWPEGRHELERKKQSRPT